MAKMKPGSPFLYDETTGDIVGVKDADGSEGYFLTTTSANGGATSAAIQSQPFVSDGYYLHYNAAKQTASDTKVHDISGAKNDGIFGANLPAASAWANAGYISTLNPGAGATDSVIRIPPLIWDFTGGESLLIFWKGIVTPEAADESLMGNTAGATPAGMRVRVKTTGAVDFVISSGGTQYYASGSSAVCFEAGKVHSFAIAIDAKKAAYSVYVDGKIDKRNWVFNGNVAVDCRSVVPWTIGASSASPGGTAGIATQTSALVMLRGRVGLGLPADVDDLVSDLHRTPDMLVNKGAW